MQTKFVVIVGAALVVVAAAFAGGYFLNRQSGQLPQPQVAQAPAPATQQPASVPVSQGPTAAPPPAAPSQAYEAAPAQTAPRRHRYHDYADREYENAAPPPPPPSQSYENNGGPDPFEGRFSTFPMRHEGAGTVDAPLAFVAQTVWGTGHEADLRVSIVVPEPAANDRGEFQRKWVGGNHVDLMPDITHGTPVFVTGSAAAILTVDLSALDLDTPAMLLLRGADGERIYRSTDVAPARGASWDERGVRWIFAIDEDFYRMLRNGADAALVVRHRGPYGERDAQIPFSTAGFPDAARAFEWQLSRRINNITAEWQQAGSGAPQAAAGPPSAVSPPSQPAETNAPPPTGNRWQNQPAAQNGPWASRYPPATNPQNQSAPPSVTASGTLAPNKVAQQPATLPPAPAIAPQSSPPAVSQNAPPPAPGKLAAVNPASVNEKIVSDFHPPTDNCGPQPAFAATDPRDYLQDTPAQLDQADAAASKVQAWLGCRQQWLGSYQAAVEALPAKLGGVALRNVNGGPTVVSDFQTARRNHTGLEMQYRRQTALLARAHVLAGRSAAPPPAGNATPH